MGAVTGSELAGRSFRQVISILRRGRRREFRSPSPVRTGALASFPAGGIAKIQTVTLLVLQESLGEFDCACLDWQWAQRCYAPGSDANGPSLTLPASFDGTWGSGSPRNSWRLRIVERARALSRTPLACQFIVFIEAANPAIAIHGDIQVELVAGRTELRGVRPHERLQEVRRSARGQATRKSWSERTTGFSLEPAHEASGIQEKITLAMVLFTCTMLWHMRHPRPARASGRSTICLSAYRTSRCRAAPDRGNPRTISRRLRPQHPACSPMLLPVQLIVERRKW